MFPAAIAAALAADAIVLSLGNSLVLEMEGHDRASCTHGRQSASPTFPMALAAGVSIDLPVGQKWLVGNITAALASAGKSIPVVAVTCECASGCALALNVVLSSPGFFRLPCTGRRRWHA